MMISDWRDKVIFAYIEEPPFAWTNVDGRPTGNDIVVGMTVLQSLGIKEIEMIKVTFPDLLPGVANHQWHINVPMFITKARSQHVQFSRPVWALIDGFILRRDTSTDINKYEAIAQNSTLSLGVVRNQVQHQTALKAGIPDNRIQIFETQEEVVEALLNEEVDAYTATAMGHRAYIEQIKNPDLIVEDVIGDSPALGGYSFAQSNEGLAQAFDQALTSYMGTLQHRKVMLRHGFTASDIDRITSDV